MLLGAVLTHTADVGTVAVRLTEVEAYEGVGEDPGSHAHRGRTARNRTMFGPAGRLYAYFTYGIHTCANVTCGEDGRAAAVLLRAGEVVLGADLAVARRGAAPATAAARTPARGPANLAVALGIALGDDGADLLAADGPWSLELPTTAVRRSLVVIRGPRVGVSGDGGSEEYPWRFFLAGEPSVSAYRRAVRRPARTASGDLRP